MSEVIALYRNQWYWENMTKRTDPLDVVMYSKVPASPTLVNVTFASIAAFEVARTSEPMTSVNPTSTGEFDVLSCAWLTRRFYKIISVYEG